jgi:hypothetical protein
MERTTGMSVVYNTHSGVRALLENIGGKMPADAQEKMKE